MKLRRIFATVSLYASASVTQAGGFGFTENLNDAVNAALNNIPAIKSERSRLQGFEQEVVESKSGKKPLVHVRGSLGYQHVGNESTRRVCDCSGYVTGDRHGFEFSVTQNVYDGDGNNNRIKASKSRVVGQEARIKDVSEGIAVETVNAYVDVLRHRALVDLARENVAKGEELTTIVSLQVEKGKAANVDNALAESRLQAARSDLETYLGDLKDAEVRYSKLTGHEPGDLEELVVRNDPVFDDEQMAINDGVASHPAILAATEAMNASDAEAAATKQTRVPRIDAEFIYRNERNADGILGDDDDYKVSMVVSYDLYAGGRDLARSKRDQFIADSARFDLDDSKLNVKEAIRRAFTAYTSASKNLEHLTKQIEADDKILSAYTSQLQIGRRTPLDVFVVQDSLFQSRIKERDTYYQRLLTQHELLSAMGQLNQALGLSI